MSPSVPRSPRAAALAACAAVLLASCGMPEDRLADLPGPVAPVAAPPVLPAGLAMAPPTPFRGATATPDLLVYARSPLPSRLLHRVAALPGVRRSAPLGVGVVALGGRTLRVAAADPGDLRRFTGRVVATADDVWGRVAGGEAAVAPPLRALVEGDGGYLRLGQQPSAPRVYVGAYATLPPTVDVVVNPRWGRALGMPQRNAVLVAAETGAGSDALLDRLRTVLGRRAAVQPLSSAAPTGPQAGYLTGGAVAQAVGSFTYVPGADGTARVDPAWVAANIRTEQLPILGSVTCHRVMLPQLRAALQEIVQRGLAAKINPDEYGGCFYPRYIGYDPAKGLSLHSWGIAFDVNVPGNQRGTAGEIDRQVVAIFKKWGFAWGGDWSYTDPMHFELAALLSAG